MSYNLGFRERQIAKKISIFVTLSRNLYTSYPVVLGLHCRIRIRTEMNWYGPNLKKCSPIFFLNSLKWLNFWQPGSDLRGAWQSAWNRLSPVLYRLEMNSIALYIVSSNHPLLGLKLWALVVMHTLLTASLSLMPDIKVCSPTFFILSSWPQRNSLKSRAIKYPSYASSFSAHCKISKFIMCNLIRS